MSTSTTTVRTTATTSTSGRSISVQRSTEATPLRLWSWTANRKSAKDIDDLLQAWDRADRWDVMGLQQILTSNKEAEEITARQGHLVLINRHREGSFSTAIALHRCLAGLPREVRHGERWSAATIHVPTATTARPLHLQVCCLHLPSAIGDEVGDIETLMRDIEQLQGGGRREFF